jgi:hypothetical protein
VSPSNGNPLLLRGLFTAARRGRQLQHDRPLPRVEASQQYDLSVRKLEGIVVSHCSMPVDLPEDRGLVTLDGFAQEPSESTGEQGLVSPHWLLKGQLGPGEKADRHASISLATKPTSTGPEVPRHEAVIDFRRPRRNIL